MEMKSSSTEELNLQRMRSRTRRNWLGGLNAGAAVFLMFALMVFVNMLSVRHYGRFDLSQNGFYQLSGKTRSLLNDLRQPVNITVFIQPGHEVYHQVYDHVLQLLREYEHESGDRVRVERVDPDRNLGQAEFIMRKFQLTGPNVVVVEFGAQFKVIKADDLAEIDYLPVARGQLPRMTSFRGEQVISSVIFALTQTKAPRVYYLQGHRERDFEDHDEVFGLSRIGQQIRRDFIELMPFDFKQRYALPEDADAIIIAGPSLDYATAEIKRLEAYARRAGRLIIMLNSDTDAGFAPLLADLGIRSVDNVVVDPASTVSGYDVLISDYRDHPITASLQGMTTYFDWPRGLPLLNGEDGPVSADKPQATPLAFSSARSWGESNLEQRPYKYDPDRDLAGPLPLAVAVRRGSVASRLMEIPETRVVVVGDVDFISNRGLSGANADFFMNALNWVLDREQLLEISAKPVNEIRLIIHQLQMRQLFFAVVVGVPAVAALAGFIVWWRRRA
jgi:ABC-type uncharacterized transport system involved in gliding motility auxiliary subunit